MNISNLIGWVLLICFIANNNSPIKGGENFVVNEIIPNGNICEYTFHINLMDFTVKDSCGVYDIGDTTFVRHTNTK